MKALRGTKDILPGESLLWGQVERSARKIFPIYGYNEIRTPIIEEASLFIRSIGETTDIVQKEMYVFADRGGRHIALRPEATASVVRAYLQHYSGQSPKLKKFFYIGPMFRSERPQKGRQRQFHQLGVELIGSDDPFRDAEVISLAVDFLQEMQIQKGEFSLKLNSLGCEKDKAGMLERHRKNLKPYIGSLCEECKKRFNKNVLRIFDCKNPECAKVVKNIKFDNLLCKDCNGHFESVKKYLEEIFGIKPEVDPRIVRGLDYYTKTVFEITHKDLGAKDAICAGGRYNNLIGDMGGTPTPAIGFSFGMERLVLVLEGKAPHGFKKPIGLFIVATHKELQKDAFKLLDFLRKYSGVSCDVYFEEKSLKGQMKEAQRRGAQFVIIFGEEESKNHKVGFKDMNTGQQEEIDSNQDDILRKVQNCLKRGK